MQSHNTFRHGRGFTLVEIVVVLAIFGLLVGLGLFMSMDAYRGFNFRSERDVVVSELQRARSHAMANRYGKAWGVCYIAPDYIVFRGTACVAGASTNELLSAAPSVTITGLNPPGVVFSQLSGATTATTIQITQDNRTTTVSINHEGTINW